jgi:IclR family acetate operon transcriptional repressor
MSPLRKAVDVLQVVAGREGISARDIAAVLGLPKSTAHRMVLALVDVGFLQRSAGGEGFSLGPLIGELAGGQLKEKALMQIARPQMVALRDRCGETVGLHVIQRDRRVLLDQAESRYEHRWVYSNPGVPMPLHAGAASKMLLALLSEREAEGMLRHDDLVAFTMNTPQASDGLLSELGRIRNRGYAISLQEVTPGISSIAVPIPTDPLNFPRFAVMTVTGPRVRLSERALRGLLPQLREAAAGCALPDSSGTPAPLRATNE